MKHNSRINPDWEGKVILVAEDTTTSILFYKAVLKKTKASLIFVRDGFEAIEAVKKEENISVVLMDINMPESNGIDATREIKKIRPHLPVIIQTAYVMNNERISSFEAGADGFIAKPVTIKKLFEALEGFLKKE